MGYLVYLYVKNSHYTHEGLMGQEFTESFYIYAVYFQSYLKVGITKDIYTRLKQIEHGLPFPLEIMRIIFRREVDTFPITKIEKAIHRRIRAFRMNGEWFRKNPYTEDVVNYFLDSLVNGFSFLDITNEPQYWLAKEFECSEEQFITTANLKGVSRNEWMD